MSRPADLGAGFGRGDRLWSPNGELAWCILYGIQSTASWNYFNPETGLTAVGPKDLTLYHPTDHRPIAQSDRAPKQ